MGEKTYPNTGSTCNLGRYRTGEEPREGDCVHSHGDLILSTTMGLDGDYVVKESVGDGFVRTTTNRDVYAARFDLISRAEPAPAEPAAEGGCGCQSCWNARHDDWACRPMIVCSQCGNKRCPKATFHGNACTNSNATGQPGSSWDFVKPDAPPAAVITNPGKYRTQFDDEDDEPEATVEVIGKASNGLWYGMGVMGPDAWDDAGKSLRWPHDGGNITGHYVPPPEPVLTITETHVGNGWVHAWSNCGLSYAPNGLYFIANDANHVGYLEMGEQRVVVLRDGPFLCREAQWQRVQQLVERINAEAAKS